MGAYEQNNKNRIAGDSRWRTIDPYFEWPHDIETAGQPTMTIEHAERIEEAIPLEDPTARAYAVCHRLAAATLAAQQREE